MFAWLQKRPSLSNEHLVELEQLRAENQQLREQLSSLQHDYDQLKIRLQELEAQIAKTSSNSSKPPSSDGLKKPCSRSLREKSLRKTGGQAGHPGHTLAFSESPDHLVLHSIACCEHCQQPLETLAGELLERRQVVDLPPIQLQVTEHRIERKTCPACGQATTSAFPATVVAPVQYGPRLHALVTELNTTQLLPLERTSQLVHSLTGHRPSEEFILQAQARLVQHLEPFAQAAVSALRSAAVANFDESGLRVAGRLHWVHVAATACWTFYLVHARRGQEAMEAMAILPYFQGRGVHDHWKPYFTYETCRHALCNAHHLRELQAVTELWGQTWAAPMSQLLRDILHAVETARAAGGRSLTDSQIDTFEQRYHARLQEAEAENPLLPGRKQTPSRNLLNRLTTYRTEVLAFMYDFAVPFDNNQAERDIRMVKLKQKISGSFRTLDGAQHFGLIRSYLSTARKSTVNTFDALVSAFQGEPFIPSRAPT